MSKTPPKSPMPSPPKSAGSSKPLPEGARHTPGSQAYRRLQGAKHPGHVEIGENFVADPRGGPELKIGKRHIHIEGDPKHEPR
jgi:hypothetical protein